MQENINNDLLYIFNMTEMNNNIDDENREYQLIISIDDFFRCS